MTNTTTQTIDERIAEIEARARQVDDIIDALCTPKGMPGAREWTMSIPARPDHDPDLVIGQLTTDVDWLLAELRAAREVIAWYADKANYRSTQGAYTHLRSEVFDDYGDRARAYLNRGAE